MEGLETISVNIPQERELLKIPTGIPSFDSIVRGGFPSGSLILLRGDVGAGNTEFSYTSSARLSLMKNDPATYESIKNNLENYLIRGERIKLPENICYISFSRSKEDIIREMEFSFPQEFSRAWNSKSFFFKDFSSLKSMSSTWDVEKDWPSMRGMRDEGKMPVMRELISSMEFYAPGSVVIIDSLTRLIRACDMNWNDLLIFLEDIQRQAKKWGGLVYILAGRGSNDAGKDEELMDIVDGVLDFEWIEEGFKRKQTVHIKKFRGLLPRLGEEDMAKFGTSINEHDGFVVKNVKHISGHR